LTAHRAKAEGGSILKNIVQIAAGGHGALALDSSGNMYMISGTMCTDARHMHVDSKKIDTNVSKTSASANSSAFSIYFSDGNGYSYGESNLCYLKKDGSAWILAFHVYRDDHDLYYPGGDAPHQIYTGTQTPKLIDIFASPGKVKCLGADGKIYNLYNEPAYFSNNWGTYGSNGDIYTMNSLDSDTFYYIKTNGDVWKENRNSPSFTGFNASISGAYPYDEVLSAAPFKDENDQYFVELSDAVLPELSDPSVISRTLDMLENSNIRTVGIGSSSNSAQLRNLNTLNNGKGAFYDISNIDAAMNSLADYIISNSMRPPRLINDYFLVTMKSKPQQSFIRTSRATRLTVCGCTSMIRSISWTFQVRRYLSTIPPDTSHWIEKHFQSLLLLLSIRINMAVRLVK
jgi:hypothetical protein